MGTGSETSDKSLDVHSSVHDERVMLQCSLNQGGAVSSMKIFVLDPLAGVEYYSVTSDCCAHS